MSTGELLYQINPLYASRNPSQVPCSFTESVQSNQKAARQESWILENCGRVPNHEIVLRFHVELNVQTIRGHWKRIRANLKKAAITFAAALELTTGKDGKPNNHIHYHFLIDTKMNRDGLKECVKAVCLNSGLGTYKREFDLIFPNEGIRDWCARKINYFTKFEHVDKVLLFRTGLRLKKFYFSSDWFLEQDGTVTTRRKILERLKAAYKKQKTNMPASAAVCQSISKPLTINPKGE